MTIENELLQRQVSEWQIEISRLQGLITFATKDSLPISSLQQQLIDAATGKIAHIYAGFCPDELEGFDSRDPDCPACQILLRAALNAPQQEPVAWVRLRDGTIDWAVDCLYPHPSGHDGYEGEDGVVCVPVFIGAPPPAAPVLSEDEHALFVEWTKTIPADNGPLSPYQAWVSGRALLAKALP